MQADVAQQFSETLQYLNKQYTGPTPTIGIVLGTGMGALVESIQIEKQIPYNFIPHFPVSTVESHFGKLIFGKIGPHTVVAMQGRLHYYEGYTMYQITYPIRILRRLGINTLFLSNAAGSVNPKIKKGELMVIEDHINLLPKNPLRGPNMDSLGPRFPDMSQPYNRRLIDRAKAIVSEENIISHAGVYAAVQGPNLETRAEYRYLRLIGADVVGMSTVPEVIVAAHMGVRVFATSVVTDEADPDNLKPVTVEEILTVAAEAEPRLTRLFTRLIAESEA